jgi:hypothetical protein
MPAFFGLTCLLLTATSAQPQSSLDQPERMIRPIIQLPGSIPSCKGIIVCWSAKYPELNGSYRGTNPQNSFDNATVSFGNWIGNNSFEVYTAEQVTKKIDTLRNEFNEREALMEKRIRAEIMSELDTVIAAKIQKGKAP